MSSDFWEPALNSETNLASCSSQGLQPHVSPPPPLNSACEILDLILGMPTVKTLAKETVPQMVKYKEKHRTGPGLVYRRSGPIDGLSQQLCILDSDDIFCRAPQLRLSACVGDARLPQR